MASRHAFRRPRGATAHPVDAVGHDKGEPGALNQFRECGGRANTVALRAEHGVHAGRNEHADGFGVRVADARAEGLGTGGAALGQLRAVRRHSVLADERAGDISNLLHQRCGQVMRAGQCGGSELIAWSPCLRGGRPASRLDRAGLAAAQGLDELTGVDSHRARRNAHGVDSASIDSLVLILGVNVLDQLGIAFLDCLGAGAANNDALARGHGEIARRADRLAVAALHARVDLVLHLRVELEILHMLPVIVGDDHARIHHAARVGRALELHHHLVELVAVLAAHVRRHDTAGAVLGFEVAAGAEHEIHHRLVEPVVAAQVLIALEAVSDEEVDIAVLGVAEDDSVVVGVFVKQPLQPAARVRKVLDGHRDVLEQRRRAGRARLRDLRVEPLTERPRLRRLLRVGGEFRRRGQVELTQELRSCLLILAQLLFLVRVILNEQRRVLVQLEASDLLRHGVEAAANGNGARIHQLERGRL